MSALSTELLRNYAIAKMAINKAKTAYPWYDSVWFRQYVAAKKVIGLLHPAILPQFISAFDRLKTRSDFTVQKLDRVFDDSIMQEIRKTITTLPLNAFDRYEAVTFGRLVVRNHPLFTGLQKTILPLASELAEEALEPNNNFLSLYSQCGVCDPHIDSPEAKWTLDLCIDQSDVWPIHFSQIVPWPEDFTYEGDEWQTYVKQSLQFQSYDLKPNEAVFFSGSSQWHYRDSLSKVDTSGFCNLLFFHFIPAGMGEIIHPENWPEIFGIPELEAVMGEA